MEAVNSIREMNASICMRQGMYPSMRGKVQEGTTG